MSAYLVIEAIITDKQRFAAYAKLVPGLVSKMGGEYLSQRGDAESLEGDWGETKVVLHRWPDMQAARDFWYSEEYQAAKKLRQDCGSFRIMLLDGINTQIIE